MGFKLIINNQGQFISELKNFPMDKIPVYFKKENAGVIIAMLRECKTNFTDLHDYLEKIARASNYIVFKTNTEKGFEKLLKNIKTLQGPIMILVKVSKGKTQSKRVEIPPKKIRQRFMKSLTRS